MTSRRGPSLPGLSGGARGEAPRIGARAALYCLEDAARRAGLELKYCDLRDDEMTIQSGACVLDGQTFLLVDKQLGLPERVRVIARALARMELDSIYLPPAARELIESAE